MKSFAACTDVCSNLVNKRRTQLLATLELALELPKHVKFAFVMSRQCCIVTCSCLLLGISELVWRCLY
jgi:hypothetical protein